MCKFENQTGQVTFYPNRTLNVNEGPYCYVSHTIHEISRLAETLGNRDFGPDDLIFLKIKTHLDGKRLEIRTANAFLKEEKGDLYWHPYPFAFIKEDVEGKFKFLPVILHQFEDLYMGHEKESLKADDYEVTRPWAMEINLNITGDCWEEALIFTSKYGDEYIRPIGEWFKEAIMAHLIAYLHDFVSECRKQFGGMWEEDPYRQVCYAEKTDSWRYSVPFVFVECCNFKEKKLIDRYHGALPIACKTVHGSAKTIKMAIRMCVMIIFLFFPLTVRLIPTRREPYRVIDPKSENSQASQNCDVEGDRNAYNQLKQETFLPG